MKKSLFLIIGIIGLIGVATAINADYLGYLPNNPYSISMQSVMPDGSPIPALASDAFEITGLINYLQNENLNINNIYYKVVVPDDVGNEWNLSQNFMERKPTIILKPINQNGTVFLRAVFTSDFYRAYVCCNIQKGDLLYTASAIDDTGNWNITYAGTLTNNYQQNWKSRVYNSTSSSWGNANVGAASNPDVYNRRAILHSDGVFVGYAMESINVTVPTLIKIYKV